MWQQIAPGFKMMVVLTVLTGLIYPGAVTGLCQVCSQANGSLIVRNGQVVGSELIGQNFKKPEYFQPRLSAVGSDGYDPTASGASNLGPTNQKLADRVKDSVASFRKNNPDYTGPIPADLVTASGSGGRRSAPPQPSAGAAGRRSAAPSARCWTWSPSTPRAGASDFSASRA
jgi:K+-transporting ATPase ATPase C chain